MPYLASVMWLWDVPSLQDAIAVYDKVDYIKVCRKPLLPVWAATRRACIRRDTSNSRPSRFQKGEDGKLHTGDDIELGPGGCELVGGRIPVGVRR